MATRTKHWLLVIALCLGAVLRIYEITDRSLWFDEAFSWRLVLFPIPEMFERAAADVHPPLYYVLLKAWATIFGTSLAALRGFSVTFGLASILMAYRFAATAWQSRFVGVLTALAVAVAGWQISYAWEARMYTLGIFLSLLASWLLIKAVRAERRQGMLWIAYAVTAAAFAYTHYFAFFTLAAHALFIVGSILQKTKGRIGEIIQSPRFWWAFVAALLAIALYSPWIPIFLRQNAQVQDSYWVPPIGGWSIPDTFYRMFIPLVGIPPHQGFGIVLASIPIIFTVGLWILLPIMSRRSNGGASLTVLSAATPFILAILVSLIGQSLYQDRFLVFTHVFILTAIAATIGQLPRSTIRTLIATVFIVFLGTTHWFYRQELALSQKPGARAAAYAAYASKQSDEAVIVTSPFVYFAIDHYAREELNASPPHLYAQTAEFSHFAGGPILRPDDTLLASQLDANPPAGLWVIDTTGFGGSEHDFGPLWVSEQRQVFPEVFPHQGDVILHHYRYQGDR